MSPAKTDSGYVLESLTFPVQILIGAVPDSPVQNVEWGWDWRWKDQDHFEVGLPFSGPPVDARPEKVQVSVNAVFRIVGDVQTVPVAYFAHGHAPALIFPYIRQVVDELTSRSPYGRVLLPPTNIVALNGELRCWRSVREQATTAECFLTEICAEDRWRNPLRFVEAGMIYPG